MKIVTQSDVKEINRLYLELKTYAAVSRATGFSPATVKKYVVPNFQVVDEANIAKFDRPLPDFSTEKFRGDDWGEMCELTNEEINELVELWKELEV